jgi:hypothetical protein
MVSANTTAALSPESSPFSFTETEAMFRVQSGPQNLTEWPDINLRESREIT